ncbi:MAG: hypothetical protein KGP28_04890 [Bdellovibrionales bacterium]|nr:hypothetical protein [Bdellovibrionales bacterium]
MISSVNAVEFQSSRTLGLGGAGRAAPWLTDSIYLNPSYGSFTPIYTLSGSFTGFEQGRNYNVSVQDSRTESLQAGLGFTKREQNAAVNIGASSAFQKKWGIGLGSKILLEQPSNRMTTDFTASGSLIATQWLNAALIVDNLVSGEAQRARNLHRTIYAATRMVAARKIQFYFDPFFSPDYPGGNKGGYSAGAEIGMLEDFFLRLGRFVDSEIPHFNTRGSGYGFGLGWVGPKISLEAAIHRTVSAHSSGLNGTAQSGSVQIFF